MPLKVNLPNNVGVGPIVPGMTFEQTKDSPFARMLQAYQTGEKAKGQGIENVLNAAKVPYAGQQAAADLRKAVAEGLLTEQEAAGYPTQVALMAAQARYQNAQAHQQGLESGVYKQSIPALLTESNLAKAAAEWKINHGAFTPEAQKIMGLIDIKNFLNQMRGNQGSQVAQGGQQMGGAAPTAGGPMPGPFGGGTEGGGLEGPGFINQGNSDPNAWINDLINEQMMTESGKAGAKSNSQEEAKHNQKFWAALRDDLKNKGQTSTANITALDSAFDAMKKTNYWQKGPGFGRIPAAGSEAQIVDKANAQLLASATRALQDGHINKADFLTIEQGLTRRDLTDKAFIDIFGMLRASESRNQEEVQFFHKAKQLGYSPDNAASLWDFYTVNYPPIVDGKPAHGNQGKWKDMLEGRFPEPVKSKNDMLSESVSTNMNDQELIQKGQYYSPEEIAAIANGGPQ